MPKNGISVEISMGAAGNA